MRSRLWLVLVLITFLTATKPAEQFAAEPQPKPLPSEVFMGTHRTGTSYHAMGMGLAKVVSQELPMRMSVRPYTGPGAWLPIMERGDLEIGVISLNDATWAFEGLPAFVPKPMKSIRLVARGNWLQGVMGIVVRRASSFQKITELRGLRVTSGFGPNPIVRALVEAWLDSVGMTWNDVKKVPVTGVTEAAKALQEGRADGAFGAVPFAAYIQALHAAVPIRALPYADASPEACARLAPEKAAKIIPASEVVPFARPDGEILKDTYCSVRHPSSMVAGANVDAEVVYQVLKAIWHNPDKLAPLHRWLKGWTHKQMFWAKQTVPYHSGAVRFYKEQGVWTAQTEQRQQELLRRAR